MCKTIDVVLVAVQNFHRLSVLTKWHLIISVIILLASISSCSCHNTQYKSHKDKKYIFQMKINSTLFIIERLLT